MFRTIICVSFLVVASTALFIGLFGRGAEHVGPSNDATIEADVARSDGPQQREPKGPSADKTTIVDHPENGPKQNGLEDLSGLNNLKKFGPEYSQPNPLGGVPFRPRPALDPSKMKVATATNKWANLAVFHDDSMNPKSMLIVLLNLGDKPIHYARGRFPELTQISIFGSQGELLRFDNDSDRTLCQFFLHPGESDEFRVDLDELVGRTKAGQQERLKLSEGAYKVSVWVQFDALKEACPKGKETLQGGITSYSLEVRDMAVKVKAVPKQ
jgi:hypothetical protein